MSANAHKFASQQVRLAYVFEVLDENASLQLQHIEQLHHRLAEVLNLLRRQALPISQEHHLQLFQILLNVVNIIWDVKPAAGRS